MDVGILMFVTERSLPVTELARACEERGLESLWVPEHPVVPAKYETRYALSEDGKMPRPYTELPDCFAVLAAAGAATTKLKVGTGICLVPERDALLTALQVASVDFLTGGRFLFGIGAGWLREEMDMFTPHFEHRFAFMKESVAAMRKLWTGEPVSFDGQWVKFPEAVCRPQPAQKPHPPVLIGGMGPNVVKRVAAWGDGWMPIGLPPQVLAGKIRELHDLTDQAGRAGKVTVTVMTGAPPGFETPMLELMPSRETLASYAEAGCQRLVACVPTLQRDEALRHLDKVAGAMRG